MSAEKPRSRHPLQGPGAEAQRAAALVVASWRRLSGGARVRDPKRPTLVACSGGADSSCLAIALAQTAAPIVVAHVVHDFRERAAAEADRDAVRELAWQLGRPFVEGQAPARHLPGNLEANARAARYAELERLAREYGCAFVATGHQCDDQLETVLMRLVRGSGPRGLSGLASRRALRAMGGEAVWVVRPMLVVGRLEAEEVCRGFGWAWREDATNADATRLRNAIRRDVVPALKRLAPSAARRAGESADLQRSVARVVEREADALLARVHLEGEVRTWPRRAWRDVGSAVAGEAIRRLVGRGLDGMPRRRVAAIVRAIRDEREDERRFELPGMWLRVTAVRVEVE